GSNSYHLHCILWLKVIAVLVMLSGVDMATCGAQNLVLNGSFEDYTNCPTSFGQWASVVGWTSPFTQSADYYNACASGVVCSVPLNTAGYQYPAQGDGYMGIITYDFGFGGFYREVLATELVQPLQPGVPVYITYKVSPGGFGSNVNNSATWAAKGPGLNFFMDLPTDWQSYLFPNAAVVEMPGVLADTAAWTTVSGMYVPDSAYHWLAIANFHENEQSQAQLLDSTAQSDWAYAFVDEVCVSVDPSYCSGGMGVGEHAAGTTQVRGTIGEGRLRLYADRDLKGSMLRLYTLQGALVWSSTWPSTDPFLDVPVPSLAQAVYVLKINQPQGPTQALRLFHSVQP
ncbi:MAG: hypothetical protein KDB87_19715, partial [Flavobacteriales bacterium]|nr:hypothetical protein [Flavobacteriales bacterium]